MDRRPRVSLTGAVTVPMALILVVGIANCYAGPTLAFTAFYVPAVYLAARFGGERIGLLIAGYAALPSVLAGALQAHEISSAENLWNGAARFLAFAFVAVSTAKEQ